jgi:DNA-binding transcriptional MerR regulator
MKERITQSRERNFIGVADLADEAASILTESGPSQDRGTVSEVPDERTVRYYQSEGLLSPAEEKRGTASVFGYRHLLQLLVVKKLQSEHLPIRKIRELVQSRKESELERLLGIESDAPAGKPSARNDAMSYLETLLTSSPASLPKTASYPPAPPPMAASMASASLPTQSGVWERTEVEPGLELHIRHDYRPPTDTKGLRRLTSLIHRMLELHGQRPRK